MFSVRSTILILALLVGPFYLKVKHYEPYPAMIFPAGAGKADLRSKVIEVKYSDLYALDINGKWHLVNKKELVFPMPIHFLGSVIAKEFGVSRESDSLKNGNSIKTREAKKWLKSRLRKQKFMTSHFKITKGIKKIRIPEGSLISEEIVDEKVLFLD